MKRSRMHSEYHRGDRIGWLRAAVLGANDGIVSTASLVLGVAAGGAARETVLLSGVSGLIAGAMSMAAGEYVSVHSQADAEAADLAREKRELQQDPDGERRELEAIYRARGLDTDLARAVAAQLMERDALGAHARDELGLTPARSAQPLQAALASAASFALGAVLPLAVVALNSSHLVVTPVALCSLLFLAALGATSAKLGGAPLAKGVARVSFWGAFGMLVTSGVGALFGTGTAGG